MSSAGDGAGRGPAPARCAVAIVLALVLVASGGALAVATAVTTAVPASAERTYGNEPMDDVQFWAGRYATCGGLTMPKLAAMMVVPTFTESGAYTTPTQAPSPMTLSRWDVNETLWAFGSKATPYQRAFWHPGVGMWQFDSAGGWNLIAATAINTWTSAEQAAKVMSSRYCASTATTDLAKIRYAWGPWYACAASNESTCLGIYNEIFDGTMLRANRDHGVGRLGGAEDHTCSVAGVGTLTCYRIDPARAQGNRNFTSTSPNIPTPITAPFYSWTANGREYRTWLSSDTGYGVTITASKPVTANARTSLSWTTSGPELCDKTNGLGACGGWTSWSQLAPSSVAAPALARNADGRLEAVWADGSGVVQHAWQYLPNSLWSAPFPLGSLGSVSSVEVARDRVGFLYAFARRNDGSVWSIRQSTSGWGSWTSMGGGISVLFDAATNADGRLELFGLDGNGAVVHQWQFHSGAWSAWDRLGGPGVYAATTGLNPDGRMELFGVDRSGTLVHSWQMPQGGWSAWAGFPGVYVGEPSVVTRSDGRLEIFVRGADAGLYELFQHPWSLTGWTPAMNIGLQQLSTVPAGTRNRDGRLEVFAGLVGAGVGNVWQYSPNGVWSSWGTFPGGPPASLTPSANVDGTLVLVARSPSGALTIASQRS
jgi:hypothetical protein